MAARVSAAYLALGVVLGVALGSSRTMLGFTGAPAWPATSRKEGLVDVPVGLANVAGMSCSWVFSHYEASEFELKWFSIVRDNPTGRFFCMLEGLQFNSPHNVSVLKLIKLTTLLGKRMDHDALNYPLMSRMHYSLRCSPAGNGSSIPVENKRGFQLIEPLYGILRDPCDSGCNQPHTRCLGGDKMLVPVGGQSKRHIVTLADAPFKILSSALPLSSNTSMEPWILGKVAPWHCRSVEPCEQAIGIVIDAGASLFGSWKGSGISTATVSMDSQSWLYNMYHLRNVYIRDFYAYEFAQHPPAQVFEAVPLSFIRNYHWINVGVTNVPDHRFNPWTLLKSLRQSGMDHLAIVKLDIDTPDIERALVSQLLAQSNSTSNAWKVDEFFYEHHVNSFHMNPAWSQTWSKVTLKDSYAMFASLRSMGIRAHSWP